MRAVLFASVIALAPLAVGTARAQPKPDGAAPAARLIAPRQTHAPVVPYPEGATGDAVVVVQLVVTVDGTVESVTVVDGDEPFASAARASAMDFRFEPATRDGVPVRATIRARIEFHPPAEAAPPVAAPPPTAVVPAAPKPAPKPERPIDIVVEGERKEVATTTVGGGEVKILPGAFGDPFRVIEALPGVTPMISGLPFFYVRGAPPGNTGYFIDGVKVPMLFHLGAGPSVLAPGLIDRVDFHPGGYPARYGRFTGGIVAGETLGAPKRLRGEWNVRLFDASALVESPLVKGKGDALVAGRYGYPGLLLSLFSPEVSLQYWDYQLRAGYRPTERDRVSVFFFGAFDKLRDKQRDTTLFDAQFHRGDLRWDRAIAGGTVRVAATLMFDQSGLGDDAGDDDRFKVQMHGVGLRAELDKRLDPAIQFRGGADVWFERYRLVFADSGRSESAPPVNGETPRPGPAAEPVAEGSTSRSNEPRSLFPSRADMLAGARADLVLRPSERVELVPGVRVDVFSQGNVTVPAVDPRLATRLRVARKVWSITTLGVTHQTPAFLVPFPGLRVATLDRGLQEAFQMAQGVELELPAKTRAAATVFHNAFRNLNDALGACAESEDDCDFDTRVPGRSYGLELLLKRDLTQRLGGWLAYTLSRSERTYRGRTFLSNFDRTHVLSASGSAYLGAGFRFGARFSYLTGRPADQSFWLETPPDPGDPAALGGRRVYAGRVRLPDFHRLDVRLEKRWTTETHTVAVVLEWFNVLFQEEAIDWRCNDRTRQCTAEYIGPVTIPSIGVEGAF